MDIVSENTQLKKAITDLKQILEENGAWFSPNLSLIDDGGSMSFQVTKPTNTRDPILKVPQKLFIPHEDAHISVKGDEFFVDPDTDKLSDVQIDITKRMFDIYNMTDKVKLHRFESPWMAHKKAPDLLSKLSNARSENEAVQKKKAYLLGLPDAMSEDDFACWSFLQTRLLGQKTDAGTRVQVLMPFIDYMNHDSYACPFVIRGKNDDERVMTILNVQPYHTSQECFVTYGVYDTVDTFLNYGFPDASAPFVRSVPMDIKIDGLGTLHIKGMSGMKNEKDVPKQLKDLSRFLPILNREAEDKLTVTHLYIPIEQAPHGMRRILQAVMRTFYGSDASRAQVVDAVYAVEEQVIANNIRFYQSMLDDIAQSDVPDDLKGIIQHTCRVQLNKVSKYMFKQDFFQMPTDDVAVNADNDGGDSEKVA